MVKKRAYNMSITIKDIAKLAGVSHTTVSRALNNSPFISEKRKAAIKELAITHGYTPNSHAKCLVLNKSFNIGLFFTTLDFGITPDYFFLIIRTLQKQLKGKYKLIIRGIDDYNGDYYLINKKTFDGVITISQNLNDDKFIQYIENIDLPQVIINRKYNSPYSDSVYSNEAEIVKEAIEFLIKNGHKKICFAKGSKDYTSTTIRFRGYTQALEANSIPLEDKYILEGDYNVDSGYQAMKKILKLTPRPTAVFFGSDNMAMGALKCINENNLSVPENISILSFDNTEFSVYLNPPLTTIDRPTTKIMTEGIKLLLNRIESKLPQNPTAKCINSTLIIRDSVKNI